MQLAAYFKLKTGKCLKNVSEIVWRTRNPSCSVLCRPLLHYAPTKNIDIQNLETVVKRRIEFYF